MIITKTSIFSKKTNTMKVPLKSEEFVLGMEKYNKGALIQDAFPTLNATEREFLLSGTSVEEQKEMFKEHD